jgi:hypothetical protein
VKGVAGKSEARSTKHEIRNNRSEAEKEKCLNGGTADCP